MQKGIPSAALTMKQAEGMVGMCPPADIHQPMQCEMMSWQALVEQPEQECDVSRWEHCMSRRYGTCARALPQNMVWAASLTTYNG